MWTVFAARVFQIAGIWGIGLLSLLYGAYLLGFDAMMVVTTHPQFVHGFFLVALAWQVAFLLIATDPVRYRLLMLPAMLEKFPFTLATLMLFAAGDIGWDVLAAGLIDGVFGVLFSIAYIMTEGAADAE